MQLEIKDIGAIKEANIRLDGLTILAGANGTGKTTVCKVLEGAFEVINNYQELYDKKLSLQLNSFISGLLFKIDDKISKELSPKKLQSLPYDRRTLSSYYDIKTLKHLLKEKNKSNAMNLAKESIASYFTNTVSFTNKLNRTNNNTLTADEINHIISIATSIINEEAESNFKDIYETMSNEKAAIYHTVLTHFFTEPGTSEYIITNIDKTPAIRLIKQGSSVILDTRLSRAGTNHANLDPAYTTPSNQNFRTFSLPNVGLNAYQVDALPPASKRPINMVPGLLKMLNTIIDGKLEDTATGLVYIDNQQQTFALRQAAGGIQALAPLILLITKGKLAQGDFLILDEPEHSLHPAWQVKFAEVLVTLVKHGVSVVLASHSPFFISALEKYTKDQYLGHVLACYLARKEPDGVRFHDYSHNVDWILDDLFNPFHKIAWS